MIGSPVAAAIPVLSAATVPLALFMKDDRLGVA